MSSPFHLIYRTWFLVVDPFLTVIGIYSNVASPDFILAGLNPSYHGPAGPETVVLLDMGAAWLCAVLILQLGLLRARPHDVTVWKYYAGAVGVVDTLICAACLRGLQSQGRVEFESWRMEEWVNLGITALCAVIRFALVLGIGVNEKAASTKKRV